MTSTHIVVWEPHPYWVPELQRVLVDQDVRICGCLSDDDVSGQLDSGAGTLVVALGSEQRLPLASLAQWIGRGAGVHIVLSSAQAAFRWLLMEQGAASVFDQAQARRLLGRHIRQTIFGTAAPAVTRSNFR